MADEVVQERKGPRSGEDRGLIVIRIGGMGTHHVSDPNNVHIPISRNQAKIEKAAFDFVDNTLQFQPIPLRSRNPVAPDR